MDQQKPKINNIIQLKLILISFPQLKTHTKSCQDIAFDNIYLPGKLVPKATNVMEHTASLRLIEHPNPEAKSPINPVSRPINKIDTQKQAQPPQYSEKEE